MTSLSAINRIHTEQQYTYLLTQRFRTEFDEARRVKVVEGLRKELEQMRGEKS